MNKRTCKKDYRFYSLWLQRILGYGSNKFRDVISGFKTPENAYNASFEEFVKSGIFSDKELERKKKITDGEIIKILDYCDNNNVRIITTSNSEYPYSLRYIEAQPVLLFARGFPLLDDVPYFSVVGTRKPTEFGEKAAFSLSARLTLSGFTIVSGGALGIDKMAHLGSLAAGGRTVAVLGCGIDNDYLKSNKKLRSEIEKRGTLISEFPPLTPATRYTFPIRNRLISALSGGVAVIEAGQKSGALITASYAMEQGKEVFAVPGSIESAEYDGNNQLLREGAIPLISVDDVISVYSGRFDDKISYNNKLNHKITSVLFEELEQRKKTTSSKKGSKNLTGVKKTSADNERFLETMGTEHNETVSEASEPEKSKNISSKIAGRKKQKKPDAEKINASENAKKVYLAFEDDIEMSDILSLRSGLGSSDFLMAVTELELKGYIKAVPVGRYRIL